MATEEKIDRPASNFEKPGDICSDNELSRDDKKKALETWEQDAQQLITASNEGMCGPNEGIDAEDHHRLGEVVRAKAHIEEQPLHKQPRTLRQKRENENGLESHGR
jgi:hypothetical protein